MKYIGTSEGIDLERALEYDKRFIGIHSAITVIIAAYIVVAKLLHKCNPIVLISLTIIICFYLFNMCMHQFKYMGNIKFFYIIKMLQMIVVAVIVFLANRFVTGSAGIIYILNAIELITVIGFEEKKCTRSTYMAAILPFGIALIYVLIFSTFKFGPFFYMLQVVMVIMGVYTILYRSVHDLKHQVHTQKSLWKQLKTKNQELTLSREQVIQVHNELVEQKVALEEANERLNRFTAEMYLQNELLSYISRVLDIDELMELVTDSILGAIGVDTCSLIIYNPTYGTYNCKVKSIHKEDYHMALNQSVRSNQLARFFELSEPHINNHVDLVEYEFIWGRQVGSLVIIPIRNDKGTYGLLIAEHASSRMINENSVQFFIGIANQINIAITNAKIYSKMEDMAKRDGLTGVHNRVFLQEVLDDLIDKANHGLINISIALFDIDKFKNINDSYGHLFGDKVLRTIACLTESYARANGCILGRYGGEEFLLIFPDRNIDETHQVMEKIHHLIKHQKFEYNGEEINVNISTGIASYPETCSDPKELLDRADHAMYFSKTHGRGRITIDNIHE